MQAAVLTMKFFIHFPGHYFDDALVL